MRGEKLWIMYLYTVRAKPGSECCGYPRDTPNSDEKYSNADAAPA
jgi:hypothetical protein